jgi:DmsE family decaheme c-type cytochrome
MTIQRTAIRLMLGAAAWILAGAALAQTAAAPAASTAANAAAAPAAASAPPTASAAAAAPGQGTQYTKKGADTCLECHDEDSANYSAKAIFRTKHAQRGNVHAPFGAGGLQCEACHGPGARHSAKSSDKNSTINSFKPDSIYPVAQRNDACMTCHQGTARTAWHAGAHERANLACTDCHKMHVDRDAVLAKATEPSVCTTCHAQQRADFLKASAHPLRSGKMACSDCHNAHGATNTAMLKRPTLNQTCYTCHAEKRGPMLWEHAPVAEDCSLCHAAHGTVRAALLNKSPPLLCQQCHEPAGHPSVARTGESLPGGSAGGQAFLLVGSCTNCHTQVHGSNHPSGNKLMR